MNKIGATETYDPCFDLSWVNNLQEANIIITKNLTNEVIKTLVENKDKCILHATITGWGGTPIEPNVPNANKMFSALCRLIELGFPANQIVVRIDPIIPTEYGLRILDKVLSCIPSDITRVRVSIIDMYYHVVARWNQLRLSDPRFCMPSSSFTCDHHQMDLVAKVCSKWKFRFTFETCAEPYLTNTFPSIFDKVGCVSRKDLDILGVIIPLEGPSRQRKTCLCPSNKVQIIKRKPGRCPHGCIYCYWKD